MSPGNVDAPGAVVPSGEAPARANQVWASLYEKLPQATLLFDADKGELLALNQAAKQLVGPQRTRGLLDAPANPVRQTLESLFERALKYPDLPAAPFALPPDERELYRAHFAPLPAFDALQSPWICQLYTFRGDQDQALQEVVTELSRLHHQRADLHALGIAVAERLRQALDTPALALLAAGEQGFVPRWHSGDPHLCQTLHDRLVDTTLPPGQIHHLRPGPEAPPDLCALRLGGPPAHGVLAWHAERLPQARPMTLSLIATALDLLLSTVYIRESHSEERMRLRAVLEHVPSAVLLFDTEGRVVMYNSRAQALIGHDRWERLGPGDHPFVVCDTDARPLPEAQWPLVRALRQGVGCTNEEYILDFGDVRRNVMLSVVPVVDEQGTPRLFLTSATDVTERSALERRKDEFLSVASHELRSPLTPLSGFVHLARQQAETSQSVDPEVLRRAEAQVMRLRRLVDALLDMSRIETGRLKLMRKPTLMTALLTRIAEPWLTGHESHRIRVHNAAEPIFAVVDPDRIEQVISNLIDNALKHGRAEGKVTVSLCTRGSHVIVSVRDQGEGMAKEDLEHIFERFYSGASSRSAKSMGLGLYITRQIVEEHGGTIEIDTSVGSPTEVRVLLPLGR
ncbi:hypothetical protein DL240_12830 [Lujinxingia litoralis]|uniref:histidine kinase n=1 Tax=Lujinxingia litoralis TaxID=2211119 RepID=A0A328C416_9DELT|nr:ATP-binding protein [Lujinxingia litoralis]RAL21732.1 hypothetical protein DL240_12830 [Lujinxingia litoralis]